MIFKTHFPISLYSNIYKTVQVLLLTQVAALEYLFKINFPPDIIFQIQHTELPCEPCTAKNTCNI